MTLLRQLAVLICVLCVALASALLVSFINQNRLALDRQLAALAHETATALAVNLSSQSGTGELSQVENRVNLAFDSGDFQEITVSSTAGTAPVQRLAPAILAGVPRWFASVFPLAAARAHSVIKAGAAQVGSVTVVAGIGDASRAFWESTVGFVRCALLALLLTVLAGIVTVMLMLRPLHTMVKQAQAISDREYPILNQLPQQHELRSIVLAMNRMSTKMRAMFEAHAEAMKRLRADSYRDALTGLANRRYFDMHVQSLLSSADEFNSGALLLIALKDFGALNQRLGYAVGDELLRCVGQTVQEIAGAALEPDYFVARLSGATFALVLSNVGERDAMATGTRLAAALQQVSVAGMSEGTDIGHIGIAVYRRQSATQFLAEADTALRAAQAKGPNAVHMHEVRGEAATAFSATRWTEFLRDVIDKKNIILHLQPVLDSANHRTILQYETLLRVVGEDGLLIPAVIFLPMAKRLGLIQQIDRLVVAEVLSRIRQDRYGRIAIAVNLFPATVQEPGFAAWLAAALRADPIAAKRIAFEISEHGALEHLDALRELVGVVRELGGQFGIDHFGRGFSSFGYLASLKLDYLKIDGSYIRDIAQNRDNQFLVDSICKIAHGLDLKVIAESVESDEDWAMLTTLKLDGVQGYGVGIPSEI